MAAISSEISLSIKEPTLPNNVCNEINDPNLPTPISIGFDK